MLEGDKESKSLNIRETAVTILLDRDPCVVSEPETDLREADRGRGK